MAPTRRTILAGLAAVAVTGPAARAATLPPMTVWKDPNCGCCGAWVDHVRAAGFTVQVEEVRAMNQVKARLGVPAELASCHTAQVGGYVLEGHVPADDVKRLLAEKPAARGLAVPGMPQGSPGMETGVKDPYEVVLFRPDGTRAVFAQR